MQMNAARSCAYIFQEVNPDLHRLKLDQNPHNRSLRASSPLSENETRVKRMCVTMEGIFSVGIHNSTLPRSTDPKHSILGTYF